MRPKLKILRGGMTEDIAMEIVEVDPWRFKVRSTSNRRKWHEVTWRRDRTFACTCKGFKYNGGNDKHIDGVRAMVE